jgi:hypothetical protein
VTDVTDTSTKHRVLTEFLTDEKISPTDIHRRPNDVYGGPTVDVSAVRRWVRHFKGGVTEMEEEPERGSL